ncbi:MAG UNVERIFIED_CONTAM: HNH endonuclease [Microcystis novacekii LVE1205-3]|jgi:5-methylcytosine-specific restriction endonuclease McrA
MSKTYIPVELRRQVYERAKGCCEYCLIPDVATFAPHEIDHIIAEKHGGRTEAENLALSCTLCNKYKGSEYSFCRFRNGRNRPLVPSSFKSME